MGEVFAVGGDGGVEVDNTDGLHGELFRNAFAGDLNITLLPFRLAVCDLVDIRFGRGGCVLRGISHRLGSGAAL